MSNGEEVQRALDYQATHAKRAAYERSRRAGLSGDPQAKREFDERWMPLQAWLDEHRKG